MAFPATHAGRCEQAVASTRYTGRAGADAADRRTHRSQRRLPEARRYRGSEGGCQSRCALRPKHDVQRHDRRCSGGCRPASLVPALRLRRRRDLAGTNRPCRACRMRSTGADQQFTGIRQPRMGRPHSGQRDAPVAADDRECRASSGLARADVVERNAKFRQRDRFRTAGKPRFLPERVLDSRADAQVVVLGHRG